MNSIGTCKFCQRQYEMEDGDFFCSHCNVEYSLTSVGDPIVIGFYYFDDPQVYSFQILFRNNSAIIWLVPRTAPGTFQKRMYIEQVRPDINPQEAIKLAKKYISLKAFL